MVLSPATQQKVHLRYKGHTWFCKVISDSSLRAGVLCMPDGGLGHLATVLRDDPVLSERKYIIALVTWKGGGGVAFAI